MHANGKRTMVWFEPERVHPDTWITNQHPEWVHGGKDGGLLDLGNPACRQWLTDHTHKVLTEQGIDDYRQDFNIDPLPFWNRADTEDRQGITEIRHVEGYFAYWDELRRRHPDMLIDSCASGGRRNDLETLRRAVPLLRSDWYNAPEGQQCLTYGLALWMPYHGTGVIYEKDAYWVRSSFYTEISFGPDTAGLDTFNFARFNKLLADWRRVATYALGDFWPLTPYSLSIEPWMVWQFDRPDLKAGVVQAFRRAHSIYETARVQLRELDAAAAYQIADFDGGDPVRLSGKELMESGLPMRLPEKPQAGIYEYRLAQ
jgi:alpha-galactosidase